MLTSRLPPESPRPSKQVKTSIAGSLVYFGLRCFDSLDGQRHFIHLPPERVIFPAELTSSIIPTKLPGQEAVFLVSNETTLDKRKTGNHFIAMISGLSEIH
jgi:hypothetical protein